MLGAAHAGQPSAGLDLTHRAPAGHVRRVYVDDLWLRGDDVRSSLDEVLERLRAHVGRAGGGVPEALDEHVGVRLLEALRPLEEQIALLGADGAGVLVSQRRPLVGAVGADGELDDDQDHGNIVGLRPAPRPIAVPVERSSFLAPARSPPGPTRHDAFTTDARAGRTGCPPDRRARASLPPRS